MIQFILNDIDIFYHGNPEKTLLDFIRYEQHLRGTKIGCREGDCGACTAMIGRLSGDKVQYKAVTSCLTPMANIHGSHIVTIEGINGEMLTPIQSSMVQCSGTQCGFCTPGFVMSLTAYALSPHSLSSPTAKDAIDGNICRCTGYKSIEIAAEQIDDALANIHTDDKLSALIDNQYVPEYFGNIGHRLQKIKKSSKHRIQGMIISGGTDVYVQKHDHLHNKTLDFQASYLEKQALLIQEDKCIIHASNTAQDLLEFEPLHHAIPDWYQYLKLVSSTPIRNIGTVVGNIANASPIGDLSVMLLALDADVVIADNDKPLRTVALRNFFKGYKSIDLSGDEYIHSLQFKIPDGQYFHFDKVCKRQYLDIATVNTAIKIEIQDDHILSAAVSAGGVSATPLYLSNTSASLQHQKLTPQLVQYVASVLLSEISPISDVRGSKEYKSHLLKNLFYGHFIHLFPNIIKMSDLL